MGYWGKVFRGAWLETTQSFGWTKKTVATVLIAIGAVIGVYFHSGWTAMTAKATDYWWIAFGPIVAALTLFIWNFFETQAKLYTSQEKDLAKFRGQQPDYTAVRLQHEYDLRAASRLWVGLYANGPANVASSDWYQTLVSAIQQGKLAFKPSRTDRDDVIAYERAHPDSSTVVTRAELKKYAASIGEDPLFLRDG